MTRLQNPLASCLIALALAGCVSVSEHCDYAAYRRIRLTQIEEDRLRALSFYARHYPRGIWAEEVAAERSELEEDIWEDHRESVDGLRFYLEVYADGPHAEDAQQRLMAMTAVTERRSDEEERVYALEQANRAQASEARRLWVTNAIQFWLRTLVQLDGYGRPIGAVATTNRAFSEAFGSAPDPVCTPEFCLKHYRAPYAIPVPGGTRLDRALDLYLRIRLDAGNIERIELLLPHKGFSRWFELEERTLVTDEVPEERFAALEWAMQRIETVLARFATGASPEDFIPEPVEPVENPGAASEEGAREFVAPPSASGDTAGELDANPEASTRSAAADSAAADSAAADSAAADSAAADSAAADEEGAPTQSISQLLSAALSAQTGSEASAADRSGDAPVAGEEPETLIFPFGLRALRRGNVRIVVFAAADQDYAEAYDGIYIERIR